MSILFKTAAVVLVSPLGVFWVQRDLVSYAIQQHWSGFRTPVEVLRKVVWTDGICRAEGCSSPVGDCAFVSWKSCHGPRANTQS
jgi:hypothetical protein